jgi:HPt (histidine-containing phosphotransfer) domain-containing protein
MSERTSLDESAWDELFEIGGPALVAELIDAFLQDAPSLLADAHRGLQALDLPVVVRASHTLKSNAATLGAPGLRSIAERVELAASRGQDAGLASLLGGLETALSEARCALEERRRTLPV